MKIKTIQNAGYTLLEVIIVTIVIGILAAITVVGYGAVRNNAINNSLMSDLRSNADQLVADQANDSSGNFPATLAASDGGQGAKWSNNATPTYVVNNSGTVKTFCLSASVNSQRYFTTQEGVLMPVPCPVLYLDAQFKKSYPESGANWYDLSGYGNNADMCDCTYVGEGGRSIVFNGTTSDGQVADTGVLDFGANSFSVEAWIKFSSYGGDYRNMIYKGASSGLSGWRFGVTTTGVLHYLIGNTSGYREADLGTTAVTTNAWHHIVVVYDRSSKVVGYIDGVKVGDSDISTMGGSVDNSDMIHIGESYTRYSGQIGAIFIRNVALSGDEVSKSFNVLRSRYGV
jgi:prepilin-type N-terminal cleavage/methylation domain-containing protein